MQRRGAVVKSLDNAPELLGEQYTYFECFSDLGADRISGFAIGSIPWSSIVRWCNLHGIHNADDIDDYVQVIGRADRMLQEYFTKKSKTTETNSKEITGKNG